MPEREVEHASAELIAAVAESDSIFPQIVTKLNERLKMDVPTLHRRRHRAEQELRQVNAKAQDVLAKVDLLNGGRVFAEERLKELSDRRRGLETELGQLGGEISAADGYEVDEGAVRGMLQDCHNAFGEERPPYQRRELLRRVLERLEISDTICRAGIRLKPSILNSGRSDNLTPFPDAVRGVFELQLRQRVMSMPPFALVQSEFDWKASLALLQQVLLSTIAVAAVQDDTFPIEFLTGEA
jgi:hypothetical protein